ncbi:hypothetical protein BGW42_001190 [Actinomortierella wolfii]|nr:hypothetical protein BGW42_001190 [Actinomortierella wolfii]
MATTKTTTTPPITATEGSSASSSSSLNPLITPANQVTATPATPPKLRTPSPRSLNPFLVSPPSGAMARTRQHSPSPRPRSARRPSWTTPTRIVSSSTTPSSGRTTTTPGRARVEGGQGVEDSSMFSPSRGRSRYSRVIDVASIPRVARDFSADLKQASMSRTQEAEAASAAGRAAARASVLAEESPADLDNEEDGTVDQVDEGSNNNDNDDNLSLLDGEDLDAFVDQLDMPFDDDDSAAPATQKSSGESQTDTGAATPSQSQEKLETDSVKNADENDALSGNTSNTSVTPDVVSVVGTDRLTGFRLRDRDMDQESLDKLLSSYTYFELRDTEGIREVGYRPTNKGLLSSVRPGGGGRLDMASTTSGGGGGVNKSDPPEWVVAGVVSAKSKPRTTAKKVRYFHFQLSDLRNHEVNVFLFRDVMDHHYSQLRVGQVVALLSPKLLSQTDRLGTIGVEVEKADNLIVIGTASDIGFCEAVKLNGSDCGKALDRRSGHYCTFHVQLAANKLRSKRGALLASTSSTFDLTQAELLRKQQILKSGGGRGYFQNKAGLGVAGRGHGDQGESAMQQARRLRNMDDRDTTYIFDDGAVGSSSLTEPTTPRKRKQQNDTEDALTAFLMNQDNPGGMYLRQAMASKEVAWAKDITSPKKTPTKGDSVLFPPDMVRRMGYDPVTGRFVPGSPKRREHDDPEARERSIRMLTERIKSPPARPSMMVEGGVKLASSNGGSSSSKAPLSGGKGKVRLVTGDVFFSETVEAHSRSPKKTTETNGEEGKAASGPTTPAKRWVNLGDDSSSDKNDDQHVQGPDGSPVLSFAAQRRKNLREAAKARALMMASSGGGGGEAEGKAGGADAIGLVSEQGARRMHASPAKTTMAATVSVTMSVTAATRVGQTSSFSVSGRSPRQQGQDSSPFLTASTRNPLEIPPRQHNQQQQQQQQEQGQQEKS